MLDEAACFESWHEDLNSAKSMGSVFPLRAFTKNGSEAI